MGCDNRRQAKLPPNTIHQSCGKPLGFPSRLDLIAWDRDVYDTIANHGGFSECGDSWVYDTSGARGVLSNDIVGNASEDPLLYAMAKRRYYKQRPTNPYKLNSIYNKPYFNEMTGESNYTQGALTNLPRNRGAMMAGIGLASSPFDYPNESPLARLSPTPTAAPTSSRTSSPSAPTDSRTPTNIISTTNIRTATRPRTPDPIAPDLGGSPQIPKSGPGSIENIDGYPTIDTSDGGGSGGGSGGGGMGGELPPMGGGEEVLEDEMMENGMVEKKYMGLTKKQGIIALILLGVAYYWWKGKKK